MTFGLEPLDVDNARLLANVHPPDWINPSPKARYHLVVIGAGTGGLVTAAIAAGLGARVALVERRLMGGDCLNVGCVPSKTLLHAVRSLASARVDFGEAMARVRAIRAELSELDSAPRFTQLGVDVFFGQARFVGRDTVAVGDTRFRFRRAVIATGARAAVPDVPGLETAGYLTNETVFNLTTLPARLAVIGAGPIACELAQAFARFGSRVTVIEQGPRILAHDDPDAAAVVERALRRDGVTFAFNAKPVRAEPGGLDLSSGARVEADAGLVAAGRVPNVDGLGLDVAAVACDDARRVVVDDRLRTTNPSVYAVGDVCSRYHFTHNADWQARLVIPNALFFGLGGGRVSSEVLPWCTYTTPELAHVGHTEASAAAAGIATETVTIPFRSVDRAVIDDATDGFVRVHVKRGSDRIVGATVVADHAGDMIGEITVAMTNGVGLGGIGKTIHPYPTQSEAWRKAADAWKRQKLTPRAKRIFARFFALLR